jgi:hypothetical protein
MLLAAIVTANVVPVGSCLAAFEPQLHLDSGGKMPPAAMRAGAPGALGGSIAQLRSADEAAAARVRLAQSNEQGHDKSGAAHRARASIPTIDVEKTCRTGRPLIGTGPDEKQIERCVSDEQKARETMAGQWEEFTARDKARCVQPGVYLPSYVEWLTCLEMERDVRALDKRPGQ